MKRASDHAGIAWNEKAYKCIKKYLRYIPSRQWFRAEHIRMKAYTKYNLPLPKSERAWGSLMVKAMNENLIRPLGIQKVSNPNAHRANANYYEKI
jgi:hypothetical protein